MKWILGSMSIQKKQKLHRSEGQILDQVDGIEDKI